MDKLKERIEELMTTMEWNAAKVASVAGVSDSAVSQWLGNSSKPVQSIGSIDAAENLSNASGYCSLWIAKGKGPKLRPHIGISHPSFEQALDTLVKTVQTTDDLTRDQIKPLINRMFDEPGRAAEIAARISAAVSSGSAGTPNTTTTTKVGNEEMPSFLKR